MRKWHSPPGWLPGGHGLGLGRYWHFAAVQGWVIATAIYVVLMLAMPPQWQRLIPSSWTIVPDALHDLLAYLTFHLPSPGTTSNPFHPYNALQKLTYFGLVFALTPLQMLTGIAMSPTIEARFPWYPKLFGNRQAAQHPLPRNARFRRLPANPLAHGGVARVRQGNEQDGHRI